MANNEGSSQRQYVQNLALAAVAGQAGCASVLIVLTALLAGLWLDSLLDWRGPFTIGLLVCSMPVSLVVMLKIALGAIRRISPPPPSELAQEPLETGEEGTIKN